MSPVTVMNEAAETLRQLSLASTALTPFLREEEEQAFLRGEGKVEFASSVSGSTESKWDLEPDFCYPSPSKDRVPFPDGSVSFHFDYKLVTNRVSLTWKGQSIHPHFDAPRTPAVFHAQYIERDSAVELGRFMTDAQWREFDMELPNVPSDQGGVWFRSIFSNISDDLLTRSQYWQDIEGAAEVPKLFDIYFNPGDSSGWWHNLEACVDFEPRVFREYALHEQERYRMHLASGAASKRFISKPLKLRMEYSEAGIRADRKRPDLPCIEQALWAAVHLIDGYEDRSPPIRIKPDRAGLLQIRMIGSLPHEVNASARAEIVERFCDHIANLEQRELKTGDQATVGLMFTASIHEPDATNDSRNYHFHVVAHDWPAWGVGVYEWNFARRRVEIDSSGRLRTTYPEREPKVWARSQSTGKTGNPDAGKNFIPSLRRKLAEICNDVLAREGVKKRYEARSAKSLGRDRVTTHKMGRDATFLARIGVRTFTGCLNAAILWAEAERQVAGACDARAIDLGLNLALMKSAYFEANALGGQEAVLSAVIGLYEERQALAKAYLQVADASDWLEFRLAKARSTALDLTSRWQRQRSDLDKAQPSPLHRRSTEAQRHLDTIDEALTSHRTNLAPAFSKLAQWRQRLVDIDDLWIALEPIFLTTRDRIQAAQDTISAVVGSKRGLSRAPLGELADVATLPAADSVEASGGTIPTTGATVAFNGRGADTGMIEPLALSRPPSLSAAEVSSEPDFKGAPSRPISPSGEADASEVAATMGNEIEGGEDKEADANDARSSKPVDRLSEPKATRSDAFKSSAANSSPSASALDSAPAIGLETGMAQGRSDTRHATSSELHPEEGVGALKAAPPNGAELSPAAAEVTSEETTDCDEPAMPKASVAQPPACGNASNSAETTPQSEPTPEPEPTARIDEGKKAEAVEERASMAAIVARSERPSVRANPPAHSGVQVPSQPCPQPPQIAPDSPSAETRPDAADHVTGRISAGAASGAEALPGVAANLSTTEILKRALVSLRSSADSAVPSPPTTPDLGSAPAGSKTVESQADDPLGGLAAMRGSTDAKRFSTLDRAALSEPDATSPSPTLSERRNDLAQRIESGDLILEVRSTGSDSTTYAPVSPESNDEVNVVDLGTEILKELFHRQQEKISKRVAWIRSKGRLARHLELGADGSVILVDGSGRRGPAEGFWRARPVIDAVDLERSRRRAIDEEFAKAEGGLDGRPSKSFAERQMEIDGSLPKLETIKHGEARNFVELLRVGALEEELEAAAEMVDESAEARAEVVAMGGLAAEMFTLHEPSPIALYSALKAREQGKSAC